MLHFAGLPFAIARGEEDKEDRGRRPPPTDRRMAAGGRSFHRAPGVPWRERERGRGGKVEAGSRGDRGRSATDKGGEEYFAWNGGGRVRRYYTHAGRDTPRDNSAPQPTPFSPTQTLFRWPPMGVNGGNCPRSRRRGSVSPIRAKAFSDGAFSPIAVPHQTRRTRLFPLLIVSPPLAPPPLHPAVPTHTPFPPPRRPKETTCSPPVEIAAPNRRRPRSEGRRKESQAKKRENKWATEGRGPGKERRRKWESL